MSCALIPVRACCQLMNPGNLHGYNPCPSPGAFALSAKKAIFAVEKYKVFADNGRNEIV